MAARKRRGSRKRSTPPPSPFARAPRGLFASPPSAAPPRVFKRVTEKQRDFAAKEREERERLREWGDSIPPPDEMDPETLDDLRMSNILDDLERLGLDDDILSQLSTIDPQRFYVVTMTITDYQTDVPADAPPGYAGMTRTVAFVGRGKALIAKIHYLATVANIEHIQVDEIDESLLEDPQEIRPLFSGDSIKLSTGGTLSGTGKWFPQKHVRLTGSSQGKRFSRPKKPGPKTRPITESRRKFEDRERKAKKRATEREAKYKALKALDPKKAEQLKNRSLGGSKGAKKRNAKRAVLKRAKVRKK